jgi:hypothetical protein
VQSGRRSSGRHASRRYRSNYWRGYRGSRRHCRNCRRRSDGWWFPAAAFATGVVIGSAASRPPPPRRVYHSQRSMSSRHVAWCRNRFRSYRVSDNTFQPYNGPRRQCISPYW